MLQQHNGLSVLDQTTLKGGERVLDRHLQDLNVFPFSSIAPAIAGLTFTAVFRDKEVQPLCDRTWTHESFKDSLDVRHLEAGLLLHFGENSGRLW